MTAASHAKLKRTDKKLLAVPGKMTKDRQGNTHGRQQPDTRYDVSRGRSATTDNLRSRNNAVAAKRRGRASLKYRGYPVAGQLTGGAMPRGWPTTGQSLRKSLLRD